MASMSRFLIALMALFPLLLSCTPYDEGVPVDTPPPALVSVPLGDQDFGDYHVAAAYYPIHGNLDNPNSAAFVSSAPTLRQSLDYSLSMPAYTWTVLRGFSRMKTITLYERFDGWKFQWSWYVFDDWHKTCREFPAHYAGQLAEHRYRELTNPDSLYAMSLPADSQFSAILENSPYDIVPYYLILRKLDKFIRVHRLNDPAVDVNPPSAPSAAGTGGGGPGQSSTGGKSTTQSSVQASPVDPFIVVGKPLDAAAHSCLVNLYNNIAQIAGSHAACTIVESISSPAEPGSAVSEKQRSYNLPTLPCPESDFAAALFPGYLPGDTFSLQNESAGSIAIAVKSSNPVFRHYLNHAVLQFDRSTGSQIEFTASALPPADESDTRMADPVNHRVTLTIHYRQQGSMVLPFGSKFSQEVIREGKPMVEVHSMIYKY
jgi:hypothetical protein